jgi:hypothetical protein
VPASSRPGGRRDHRRGVTRTGRAAMATSFARPLRRAALWLEPGVETAAHCGTAGPGRGERPEECAIRACWVFHARSRPPFRAHRAQTSADRTGRTIPPCRTPAIQHLSGAKSRVPPRRRPPTPASASAPPPSTPPGMAPWHGGSVNRAQTRHNTTQPRGASNRIAAGAGLSAHRWRTCGTPPRVESCCVGPLVAARGE